MTPLRLKALQYALDDGVLLVNKKGTWGDIDARGDVRPSTAIWLSAQGYIKFSLSNTRDNAWAYVITDEGKRALDRLSIVCRGEQPCDDWCGSKRCVGGRSNE